MKRSVHILFLLFMTATAGQLCAQGTAALNYASLADQFYGQHPSAYWYDAGDPKSATRREAVLAFVALRQYEGLGGQLYNFPGAGMPAQEVLLEKDRQFTLAFIHLADDLSRGAYAALQLRSDELSEGAAATDEARLQAWLATLDRQTDIVVSLRGLGLSDSASQMLYSELARQVDSGNSEKVNGLSFSLGMHRWIRHFNFEKYIVVNIPAATLTLFAGQRSILSMKVVVGKAATHTPQFATWCDKVVLYPYWNVPKSIAEKELLPKFKRSPAKVDEMNMQVIDNSGRQVDPYSLNWASYHRGYFPYLLRQCTGCDNALGVVKFNLTDPFSIYMHDTNNKPAFEEDERFMSHGCIRVSQPIELGSYLLGRDLDSNFLKACVKGQKPVTLELPKRVPVFVVYQTAVSGTDKVLYYEDVYRLFR